MTELEKELDRARKEVERLRRAVHRLKAHIRDCVLQDPAVCVLKVSILVDSTDPERECSRLRNALEGMIEDDFKQGKDGWLMDEGALQAEVSTGGHVKFDIPRKQP